MNSSFLLFLSLFIFFGCGVKQAPLRPQDKLVPSYIEEFEQKNKNQPPAPAGN